MIELNKIYHGDCLELMQGIEDKSIDMILTDPPYGINIEKMGFTTNIKGGIAKRNNYSDCFNDNKISKEYYNEIFRISKNQIIFGGNYYTDILYPTCGWIVWNKKGDGKYHNDFADGEMAWSSFRKPLRIYHYLWHGMIQQNMKNKEKRIHPTQKPIKLFEMILNDFTNENDTILDPFIGSGTTAIACINTNRNFIGMEKEQKYFELANERINNHKAQLKLL